MTVFLHDDNLWARVIKTEKGIEKFALMIAKPQNFYAYLSKAASGA